MKRLFQCFFVLYSFVCLTSYALVIPSSATLMAHYSVSHDNNFKILILFNNAFLKCKGHSAYYYWTNTNENLEKSEKKVS